MDKDTRNRLMLGTPWIHCPICDDIIFDGELMMHIHNPIGVLYKERYAQLLAAILDIKEELKIVKESRALVN